MRLFCAALLAPALLAMNACIYVDVGDFAHYSRDFHFNFPLNPRRPCLGGRLQRQH